MKLHELKPSAGSKKKKKRVGRGNASGRGTYSTRGIKGQKSRSGVSFYPGFEGGRTPLVKLLPKKKGFKSIFSKPEIVKISSLQKHFRSGDTIDKGKLKRAGLIKSTNSTVKLLGNGKLSKKLIIQVDKFSQNAVKIVEKSGGKILEIAKNTKKLKAEKNG